jgi:hypothetical protein
MRFILLLRPYGSCLPNSVAMFGSPKILDMASLLLS